MILVLQAIGLVKEIDALQETRMATLRPILPTIKLSPRLARARRRDVQKIAAFKRRMAEWRR